MTNEIVIKDPEINKEYGRGFSKGIEIQLVVDNLKSLTLRQGMVIDFGSGIGVYAHALIKNLNWPANLIYNVDQFIPDPSENLAPECQWRYWNLEELGRVLGSVGIKVLPAEVNSLKGKFDYAFSAWTDLDHYVFTLANFFLKSGGIVQKHNITGYIDRNRWEQISSLFYKKK